MGYYTHFDLSWKVIDSEPWKNRCSHAKPDGAKYCPTCGETTTPANVNSLISHFLEASEDTYYGITSDGSGTGESVKWYKHNVNMINLSKLFPGVLFTLHGEGETPGDLWNKYYLNGEVKVAVAEIIYPECTLGVKK